MGSQELWVRRARSTGPGTQRARGSPARLRGAVQAKRSAVGGRAASGPKKSEELGFPEGLCMESEGG